MAEDLEPAGIMPLDDAIFTVVDHPTTMIVNNGQIVIDPPTYVQLWLMG